jgi:hypothetical protein
MRWVVPELELERLLLLLLRVVRRVEYLSVKKDTAWLGGELRGCKGCRSKCRYCVDMWTHGHSECGFEAAAAGAYRITTSRGSAAAERGFCTVTLLVEVISTAGVFSGCPFMMRSLP